MIPTAKPIIDNEEIEAVKRVLESGMLAEGKVSRNFEKQFADYVGTKFATVTNNGTTALSTALEAMGIQPGDEVITTPFTFIASANSITMIGAVPVFVDIKYDTYNINPELIEEAITSKTRAIMPVHIFGMPCEMAPIMEIAEKHDLMVIEDACQAHGATIDKKKVGSIGHVGTFSFYATKNMITGEGGMITTNDQDLLDRCLMIKNHGRGPEGGYNHHRVGYNNRMLDIVAALGIVQLGRMPEVVRKRQETAQRYDNFFSDYSDVLPQITLPGMKSGYHVYAPRFFSKKHSRDDIIQQLRDSQIGARTVYALPCHKQRTYENIFSWRWSRCVKYPDYSSLTLQNSETVGNTHVDLPVHPGVTEDNLIHIFETLKTLLS
ncbi:MAG: DegT/DnrJ/EryC1/StrS family aminotransferase [Candidatus Thorarchaeota archaeon]|jgi:dTDP-4-amino-4,6-dideoxygalactose transaminase